ncbi:DNA polymerase III subunit alpha [Flavipsychrobacter stenotrophus]|uniref:DNA polymerase III subunit alpha n=1 Tax=Flavipsychrobacter stenotrophus TaxID=2077091 RepID=A0A2S7SU92_9BACT|nr:DNA polymerase III subunit alpha [Flavipsychrobacter stenotrophus]PQJ10165.1 DNA polymerase III subunit alpha [Flavipsychrobacter stenotrophus]
MKFSHLHNHTQFSLLDGASNISKLYEKARNDGQPAMAITDHGNMFGAFDFVAEAWKKTKVIGQTPEGKDILSPIVKPIVGCEFYLVENRHKRSFSKDDKDVRYHQLMLAKDEIGYKNLVKLCSLGYIEGLYGKYPRIDKELIMQYHEGLIATTCCLAASVPRTILKKGEAEGEKEFKWWLDLFGDDYYIELQRHDIADQIKVNEVLMRFAAKYNVPVIASNDSHYVDQGDANAHDILLCINTGAKQSDPKWKEMSDDEENPVKGGRFAFPSDRFYFKTQAEMTDLFKDVPQAIDNTNHILDKIKPLKLERDILLPHFVVPDEFHDDQNAFLEHLTWMGAKERYVEITAEVEERLKFELFTIRTMGFAGYFLIVSDFIKAGRDMGVFIGPGRGSAAGSAVAFCIGITNIDPIKYKLLFERFLNPDRKSMPDIDTDFDDVGRQKVIDYVVDKYGKRQVAQIVTYGTMAAKSSIKDVARTLDLPLSESNLLAKLVPERPGINLKRLILADIKGEGGLEQKEGLGADEMEGVNRLRAIYNEPTLHGEVLHAAVKLEGSVRNTGIHAAGIIIAPSDLTDLLPVFMVKDVDALITQYEGNVIENAGVIKMDFLGLKTLTIIKDALALIKRNYNIEIDIDLLPLDDELTYELYQNGETNGTFQFESAGMQKHLIALKPDKFDDLIAMNALYRPGPIEYIPNYIKRKHGQEEIVYDVPDMEEYLGDTYGITVYQEQVMLLSQSLAGFSKGDADVLRKAMGKKQKAVLDKMKGQFIEGGGKKGHPADKLQKIWTDWEAFAQYAFNKSHSTCYALVAYQTAYLKAHYPAEYMAAVLNNQGNIEKIKFYMEECQRMELQVLGPDVNESLKGFAVAKENVVRFGMNAIKGVGEAAVEDLIAEREANGPFVSVYDLIKRVNQRTVNKKSLESLVLAGALDCFTDMHRAQYFYAPANDPITGMDRLVRFGNQFQASSSVATNSLFGESAMPEVKPPIMPPCDKWGLPELLDREKEVVGIYLSAHPLDGFKFEMDNYGITQVRDLEENKGRPLRIAGYITDVGHMTSKKGSKFGKFTINDYSGNYEIMLWEKSYVQYGNYLVNGQKLLIQGTYDEHKYRPGVMEFSISNMLLLDEIRKVWTKKVSIYVPMEKVDELFVSFIEKNVKTYPGNTELYIYISDAETNYAVKLRSQTLKMELNDEMIQFLQETDYIKYALDKV